MKVQEREKEKLAERASSFDPDSYSYEDADENPADLERFYGSLKDYVRMVAGGYADFLMLDAKGGLGKTHTVKQVLKEQLPSDMWTHEKGFTTPVELYKTLYKSQYENHVLFLDDMSGIRNKQKAIDMLKAATESEGAENRVSYRSSQSIDHPNREGELPQTFYFRGSIIMSFNDTPDNNDFAALKDRCVAQLYELSFDHEERLELIREVAKEPTFSKLPVERQQECAEWIASISNEAIEVSLRTLESVCEMRHYGEQTGSDWEKMALDAFDLDHEKHLIIRLFDESEMTVEQQIEYFKEQTGRSRTHYYDLKNEIAAERMD